MLGSSYYWVLVGLLTVGFAVSDLVALSRRDLGRKQGVAIAVYIAAWGVVAVLGLPLAPLGSLWWAFPAALRIAFAVTLIGGDLLAEVVRAEQAIEHRHEPKPPSYPEHHLTAEEIGDAERYEAEWRKTRRAAARMIARRGQAPNGAWPRRSSCRAQAAGSKPASSDSRETSRFVRSSSS